MPKSIIQCAIAAVASVGLYNALAQQVQSQELRIGYPYDIVSLDPADYRHRWTEIVLRSAFDGLLTRDASMRVVPELAKTWVQVSPKVYEFRLREDIRFHDGRTLTARDVVYSFDRLISPESLNGRGSPRKDLLGPLSSVTALDELTVRFELDTPWPIFPDVLPFQQVVAQPIDANADAWTGSGPFRLVGHFPEVSILFERHDRYFGGAADMEPVGQACVDRVSFNIVPGNESRVAGLLAGDFDLIVDVQPHSIPVINQNPGTDVHIVDGTRSFFLGMSLQIQPFDDNRVRQAVAHALDREALIAEHLGGKATLIDGILGPRSFGRNQALKRYEHNPERARILLAEAGYPDGFDVDLVVAQPLFQFGEAMSIQLAAVGIRARTVVGDDLSTLQDGQRVRTNAVGKLWLKSWGAAALDPVGIFDATHRTGGRGNVSGYSNPQLDVLLDAAEIELDEAKRTELYRQAEAIINRDLPYIYLWIPQEIYGVSTRISGFQAAPDGRLNLQDVCIAEAE